MYFEVRIPGLLTTQQASGNLGFSVLPESQQMAAILSWSSLPCVRRVGAPQVTAARLQGREIGMIGSPTHGGETEARGAPHAALSHAVGRRRAVLPPRFWALLHLEIRIPRQRRPLPAQPGGPSSSPGPHLCQARLCVPGPPSPRIHLLLSVPSPLEPQGHWTCCFSAQASGMHGRSHRPTTAMPPTAPPTHTTTCERVGLSSVVLVSPGAGSQLGPNRPVDCLTANHSDISSPNSVWTLPLPGSQLERPRGPAAASL